MTLRRMRPFKSSWRDGGQHLARALVRHVAREHLLAHLLQFVVNAFQGVGGVFGVGVEELEQHVARVRDQARRAACTQAQQAEHGHVLVVDGEQHALAAQLVVDQVEDEGHARRARLATVVDQEVAADVQLAIVFLVKPGRLLDVLVHRVLGDGQAEILCHPALFIGGGRFEVDPDGLEPGELLQRFDFFLDKAPIGEREDVEHAMAPGGGGSGGTVGVLSAPIRPGAESYRLG